MGPESIYHIQVGDDVLTVGITPDADGSLLLTINGNTSKAALTPADDGIGYVVLSGGARKTVYAAADGQNIDLLIDGDLYTTNRAVAPSAGAPGSHSGNSGPFPIKAPMPGVVKEVWVTEGEQVEQGAPLLVLEAMKMNNQIRSPRAGSVTRLAATPGQRVNRGDELLILT